MAEIKGVSPDAEIVTNEHGGKQSKTAYGFHLMDTDAILALAEVLQYGASRYARDNWRRIPSEEHFNHMMIHYYAWLKGDTTDDHLGHFFCRAMMLYATGKAEQEATPPKPEVEPWGDADENRKNKMCGEINCRICPIPNRNHKSQNDLTCFDYCNTHPAEARAIMDKWEQEHPTIANE